MNNRTQKLCIPSFFFLIILCGAIDSVQAQYFWNTDFEYGVYKSQPRKWTIEGEGEQYTAYLDSTVSKSGNKSLFITQRNAETYTLLSIPGALIAGESISISGFIKAHQTDSLQLSLMIFDPSEGNVLATVDHAIISNNWEVVSLNTFLPENLKSDNVLIALVASGSGSFWFDAVQVKIGGIKYGEDAPNFREPTNGEIASLNEKAIPFQMNTVQQKRDLSGLSDIVGDARIVALGENSHGSSSIYRLKLRMLRYLVEHEGFTLFALEMPTVEADYINNYVLYGQGDIEQVLTKLSYPSWQTQEMIDLIEWLRNYNEQHGKRIEFRGYDMQNGWSALEAVKAFATKYDSVASSELEFISELYEEALKLRQLNNSLYEKSDKLLHYLEGKSFRAAPPNRVETIVHYMNVFMQSLAFQFNLEHAKSRDKYMAENIRWIVENNAESNRIIISADNTHITKSGGKTGAYLNQWYGEDYVGFGFTFKTGSYSAYGPKSSYEVHPPHVGTYEYFFSKSSYENFMLDLRATESIPLLNQSAGFRSIGSRPQEVTQFYDIDIKKHFDAVVYIETSNHTTFLKK
ncbi:erythromycin esterase family protein [Balneola vulgaris]|uniref:erythromycin esterase family protein n=1 Tax=Balneola vulgaris TaxID=287535 RepID=UPI000376CEB5|nr:erythromycin esterase family protein [Balneola vulgaris]